MNRKKYTIVIVVTGAAFLLIGGQIFAAGMGRGRGRGAAVQGAALQQNLNNQVQDGQNIDPQAAPVPGLGRGQGQGLRRGPAARAAAGAAQNPGQLQWRRGWTQGFMRGFAAGRQSVLDELTPGQAAQLRQRLRQGAQLRQDQVPGDETAIEPVPLPGQGLRRGQAGGPIPNAVPGPGRGQGRGFRRGQAVAPVDVPEPPPVPEN